MKRSERDSQMTVTGVVTPTDWNEDGNVVPVAISTPLEEEYLIAADEIGQELLDLYGAQAVATGIVGDDKHGNKAIMVSKYELLEEENEEEEEFEEEEELDEEEFEEEEELDEEDFEDDEEPDEEEKQE